MEGLACKDGAVVSKFCDKLLRFPFSVDEPTESQELLQLLIQLPVAQQAPNGRVSISPVDASPGSHGDEFLPSPRVNRLLMLPKSKVDADSLIAEPWLGLCLPLFSFRRLLIS